MDCYQYSYINFPGNIIFSRNICIALSKLNNYHFDIIPHYNTEHCMWCIKPMHACKLGAKQKPFSCTMQDTTYEHEMKVSIHNYSSQNQDVFSDDSVVVVIRLIIVVPDTCTYIISSVGSEAAASEEIWKLNNYQCIKLCKHCLMR